MEWAARRAGEIAGVASKAATMNGAIAVLRSRALLWRVGRTLLSSCSRDGCSAPARARSAFEVATVHHLSRSGTLAWTAAAAGAAPVRIWEKATAFPRSQTPRAGPDPYTAVDGARERQRLAPTCRYGMWSAWRRSRSWTVQRSDGQARLRAGWPVARPRKARSERPGADAREGRSAFNLLSGK